MDTNAKKIHLKNEEITSQTGFSNQQLYWSMGGYIFAHDMYTCHSLTKICFKKCLFAFL